jgi:two-component system, NtrC family, sensor kinase
MNRTHSIGKASATDLNAANGMGIPLVANSGTTRYLRVLLAAVVIIPIVLITAVSWLNYNAAFQDAHDRVSRAADAILEYALKVFETDELILDHVAEHVSGMDWSELVRSQDFHRYLQQFGNKPQVSSVGLIDQNYGLAATNPVFPAPSIAVEPPGYLAVERGDKEAIYIGTAVQGSLTPAPQFSVVRPQPNPTSAGHPGLIFVTTKVSDFVGYYRSIIDPQDYTVTLARSDGAVLAHSPGQDWIGRVLSPASRFRHQIAERPEAGSYDAASDIDGVNRLFAYRKLSEYPVYAIIGLNRSAIIAGWSRLVGSHLMFGLPATLCLVLLAIIALRRSVAADRAAAAVRAEVNRREVAEASLRQVQKMEVVGQLTGGVAHDFNNLLTAIGGNLDLILRRSDDSGRVRRLAEAALQATQRGERITQQLLVFSRRQVLRPETLNLNRVLVEFEALMTHAVSEKIDLQLQLDAALDPSRIDRAQFEAALLNLMVNARDALPNGGRVVIETRNVLLDQAYADQNPDARPGAYVLVSVSDNGVGIDPSILPHVFEPFFTTKDVGRGSGLGLSQVYGFAEQSGGHVKIYSEVGIGTTVKLYLPKASERLIAGEKQQLIPLRSANGGETVLVVEDDEAVLAMAIESLTDLGYRVLVAHDSQEALAIVKGSERIDILFSDIVMPGGINGAQLAVEARRLRPDIKVLLTSGYTAAALSNEHGLPEELPILSKPYRRDELAAQLRVIAGGRAS